MGELGGSKASPEGEPRHTHAVRESQTCKEAATERGRSCRVGRGGAENCKRSARHPSSVRSERDETVREKKVEEGWEAENQKSRN
jgi:hypothetical protein